VPFLLLLWGSGRESDGRIEIPVQLYEDRTSVGMRHCSAMREALLSRTMVHINQLGNTMGNYYVFLMHPEVFRLYTAIMMILLSKRFQAGD
jgi:hypothetical protein